MQVSIVIKIPIERPYAEVYEFLADPHNLAKWAADPDSEVEPLDGGDWLVQLSGRARVLRPVPRNTFGVLDYQSFAPGERSGPTTPARLVRNGEGCEMIMVWRQHEGVSDERFRSDAEWVESDMQRLKTLLEARLA
jgi:hypothetical protein